LNKEKPDTCFSCGIKNKRVEAQGIWYCPNALCQGCGGAWFRATLESYKECCGNGRHTVDEVEWLTKGIIRNKENKIKITYFHRSKNE